MVTKSAKNEISPNIYQLHNILTKLLQKDDKWAMMA